VAGAESEFDLIARIRARAGMRDDVSLGIGDDAAILRVPAGHDLIVGTDTLNIGVHFPAETAPSDIGWKALAVNLSDLAAMGAKPAWCTLNLTLPSADSNWLDAFLDGFLGLAKRHDVSLVGGDTTRGPLSVTVTAHGFVPCDAALRRSGAQAGDDIWVSGTLGDAAAALRQWRDGSMVDASLRERLGRPLPRVGLGLALRGVANACIDVSDGLLADIGHILDASRVGAELELASLPTSPELASAFDAATRIRLQLSGGDDYELCFTVPPAHARAVLGAARRSRVAATRIGRIEANPGLRMRDGNGAIDDAPRIGYRHFDETHDGRASP
jgi:thiamine-monophosphate kinase